jgi:DNA-binding FadR family transcriptional regulator
LLLMPIKVKVSVTSTGLTGIMLESRAAEKPRKIANIIAAAIEQDIIENRIAVGTPLATEAELCSRYGVSRWAIREAIAIVQNDGLITVRRGRAGGAEVSCTPGQSLAAAICGFLLYARMDNEHIIQARAILDRLLFEAACSRPSEVPPRVLNMMTIAGRGDIHTLSTGDLFEAVLDLSGSTVTSVMASALSNLTLCRLSLLGMGATSPSRPDLSYRFIQMRYTQLRSFIGLDAEGAYRVTAEMAVIFRYLFAQYGANRQPFADMAQRREIAVAIARVLRPKQELKPAGVVSTMLMLDAIDARADGHGYLGSELILAARYGVPRNMLREGIRILERDGFIRTEQGRSGGILIGEPDETEIVERAVRFFTFAHCPPNEVDALIRDFRMLALDLLLTQPGSETWLLNEFNRLAAQDKEPPIVSLFEAVARRTGNSLFLIIEKIGAILAPHHAPMADQRVWLSTMASTMADGGPPLLRRRIAELYQG